MKFVQKRHAHALFTVCLLAFIFTFQSTLPVYINSSFLGHFVSETAVSLIYAIGSLCTIILFFMMSRILRRYGNYATTFAFILILVIASAALALDVALPLLILFFILAIVATNIIIYDLDLFLEHYSDDLHTGGIRGMYLTVVNTAWILSPILVGALVGDNHYAFVYLASALLLGPFAYLLRMNFKNFKDSSYDHFSVRSTLKTIWSNKDLCKISVSNSLLQFFYAWMIIYTPIYLHEHIGFDWGSIGIIFTIMLLPFVLIQLPLGRLADKKWGEKELLSIGFIITAGSTILLSFITVRNLWLWALMLFITRIGAAMIEVMNETYFFKKIDGHSSSVLSFFRITRPIAYVVAPLIASITLYFVSFKYSFIVLAVIVLCGLKYSLALKDTK